MLWIQRNPLRGGLYLAAASLFLFGGLDLIAIGPKALPVALVLSLGVFGLRFYAISAPVTIVLASILACWLPERITISAAIGLAIVALVAAFESRSWALVTLGSSAISGLVVIAFTIFSTGLQTFGFSSYQSLGEQNFALLGCLLWLTSNALAFLLGRLSLTIARHVGTPLDRLIIDETQSNISLQIAEQDARIAIAKDISELAIQRLTAAVSLVDGASFTLRGESELAARSLDQISKRTREAHVELRRLYDLLNPSESIGAAAPGVEDIDSLVLQHRELGYNITLNHLGDRHKIEQGLEITIYRIVFDALANVRKHVDSGADVTVDFSWTPNGLQVLVKDNGVEFSNRNKSEPNSGYSAEDDRKALVETITGADLTAMRERAALYGGSIEATRVPGVGFTLSAIFPNLGAA